MSEEYDLKKSKETIGQLYPILKSKDGQIVDGFHREKADANWKTLVLPEIDNEEKFWTARIIANTRRDILYSERERWFNELAEVFLKQGIKPDGSIVKKVMETTGYSERSVTRYLGDKYKMQTAPQGISKTAVTAVPQTPIDIVKQKLGSGYNAVEKEIEKNLRMNIEEETKEKLLKSPEFQREVIQEIHKEEAIAEGESCPILSDDVDTPDESITPMPANPKTTLTITCPKCGFKFEF